MKKLLFTGLISAAGLLCFSGCQNTVNTVENAEKQMTPNTVADKRFVTDSFLRDRLKLVRVVTAETKGGFMKVQVEAINLRVGFFSELWSGMTDNNPYRVSYKFSWLDKDGMAAEKGVWLSVIVKPGETAYFNSVAPTKDCKDFVLNIKEAE